MRTEIGEYVVGAWLKVVKKCSFIDYNVRPPIKGLEGLGEFDVVGLDLKNKKVFICEVVTHLNGMGYKDLETTVKKVEDKFMRQQKYAKGYLPNDFDVRYMLWSPIVTPKYLAEIEKIAKKEELELVINSSYSTKIDEIKTAIKGETKDFGNPFIRVIQIFEALKCPCDSGKKYKKCCGGN